MRQTTMDRWIEAAEARRVSQIVQEGWAQPPAPMQLPDPLLTRLRSMVFNSRLACGARLPRVTGWDA
jgi:hypothetical protein